MFFSWFVGVVGFFVIVFFVCFPPYEIGSVFKSKDYYFLTATSASPAYDLSARQSLFCFA